MNLSWHIIITQSPEFALDFTFGDVQHMGWQMYNDVYLSL